MGVMGVVLCGSVGATPEVTRRRAKKMSAGRDRRQAALDV